MSRSAPSAAVVLVLVGSVGGGSPVILKPASAAVRPRRAMKWTLLLWTDTHDEDSDCVMMMKGMVKMIITITVK